MTEPTQTTEGEIPAPIRDLLVAIRQAVTLPGPAGTLEDLSRHQSVAAERMHLVQLAIHDVLGDDSTDMHWEAEYLRKKSAAPVRYRTPEQWLAELKRTAAGETGSQDAPDATA
ncbi:hypothetical protein OHB41_21065 [Streptomyces sp. NBC_01571]|uniref:hypothetical protein n=1 Tax=Streptomyces sp. NBC_01571 TaxID=2975883 RepID=UPI0022515E2E|nr:hypothetical protein [Streptomyces sp. NBC_01571]MCX4575635.1 hypothetical protein [Streptomyces sp. NBC_01571]